jgi:hypothetical protein
MRYILILVILACGPELYAGLGQGDIACRVGRQENPAYKKKLWDGYEISLGPVPHALDYGCTAAIYNAAGKVVFRTTGFGVIFDEGLTGEDFDGDGKAKVVFQTDAGGGAHCCWIYNVVSLFPKPRHLFDVGIGAGVWFEKDEQGKMVIWQYTPGPYQYTEGRDRPYAERVFRVRDGKLVDSTPEFCSKIFAPGNRDYDQQKRVLTPEKLKQLSGGMEKPDSETASALLSRALQHVFCRQFDEALSDLNLWPEATRDDMKSDFVESIKTDYSEFAARLQGAQ